MPGNDREVFEYLTSNPNTLSEIDYLTYALFAQDKKEWIAHWEDQRGIPPSQADIDGWIANLSPHHFAVLRQRAVDFFDTAAHDYMAAVIQQVREDAINSAVVSQVKAVSSVWRQLGIALLTAILAPVLLGAIIVFGLTYEEWFPTIRDFLGR